MLDRRLADVTVEEREALDIDLSPREYVIDYLAKSFPVRLMQVFADEDGNLRSEAMSDEKGNPVFCPRAIAARDALTAQQIGRASCRERVCQRVDLGGRRIIQKTKPTKDTLTTNAKTKPQK